jgi:hypothetical protein
MCWEIPFSLRVDVKEGFWKSHGSEIEIAVVAIGTKLGVPSGDEPVDPALEAAWRARCWQEADKIVKRPARS